MMRGLVIAAVAIALASCATVPGENMAEAENSAHPEATPFSVTGDAMARVDAALEAAAANDSRALIVLGANWCHDSRALAGWLETERFQSLLAEHYELVYVNVGLPQTGDGHNLDIARRFGHEVEGTPNLLVVTPEGLLVNGDTATTWRNSASRSEDAIYEELDELAHRPAGIEPVEGIEIAQ